MPRLPEMKPRTLCACQSVAAMMSASVAPSGRLSMSRTMAFLLPSRVVGVASLAVAPLAALAFFGATGAAWGAGAGVSAWMAFQIRETAVLRSVNFLTGLRLSKGTTPAKAFQTSGKRASGPVGGELGELLLGGETVLAFGNLLGGGEGGDVVVGGDCECGHGFLLIQNSISSTIRRASSSVICCALAAYRFVRSAHADNGATPPSGGVRLSGCGSRGRWRGWCRTSRRVGVRG